MTEFRDGAAHLSDFGDVRVVACPRCGARAVVRGRPGWEPCAVRCGACGLSRDVAAGEWLGRTVLRAAGRCGRCGRPLQGVGAAVPGRESLALSCPGCGETTTFAAGRSREHREGEDPWTGLPLWYRGEVRGNVLWALNDAHLAFLRGFVAADQRKRAANHNASMVSRLPRWLKAGKERARVLAELERMAGQVG